MTEDRLEKLTQDYRRLQNLAGWLDVADRIGNARAKLNALFEVGEVNGWVSEETLLKCYHLIKPELEAARERLEREWDEA